MLQSSQTKLIDNQIVSIGTECVKFLNEKKAINTVFLDLKKVNSYLDYFIICTANSRLHCRNLAKSLEKHLTETEFKLFIHPDIDSEWIILDYNEIVFHIFTEEMREYYDLDKLWADAKIIN